MLKFLAGFAVLMMFVFLSLTAFNEVVETSAAGMPVDYAGGFITCPLHQDVALNQDSDPTIGRYGYTYQCGHNHTFRCRRTNGELELDW